MAMKRPRTAGVAGAVRPMTAADVAPALAWRNHPAVRAVMFTQHEITLQESRRWFEAASADPLRHLLIYEQDGTPTGFASLARHPDAPEVADWGFYVAPGAPRGSGTALGVAVLAHAFGALALEEVRGAVLGFNAASLRLHDKLGFRRRGEDGPPVLVDGQPQAVIRFVLRRADWRAAAHALSSSGH